LLVLSPRIAEREGEGYIAFEDRSGGAAVLRDHTIVIASIDNLRAVLDRYARRVRGRPIEETIGVTLDAIESQSASLGGAARVSASVSELLEDAPEPLALAAAKLSSVGLRVDVREGVTIRVLGRGPDAETVETLGRILQSEVDKLRRHPVAILLGVRGMLGAIRIEPRENDLYITLALSREQVESLARGIGAFVSTGDTP
jgi:hypothetical protein